jgi:predicted RNA-binding Zn ribbon-like protein
MAWSATTRFDIEPAPAGLALVQDLLNTASAGPAADLLAETDTAQTWVNDALAAWSTVTEQHVGEIVLDAEGLHDLRAFRDNLRDLIAQAQNPEEELGSGATGLLTGAAVLHLGEDGLVQLRPQEADHRMLVTLVLAALLDGQQTGTKRRLKTCRNPRCRVAFYDHSRNSSGVWHSVRTCGNVSNLRAHRARRRAEQP